MKKCMLKQLIFNKNLDLEKTLSSSNCQKIFALFRDKLIVLKEQL